MRFRLAQDRRERFNHDVFASQFRHTIPSACCGKSKKLIRI
jgi:hypothetical protein